MPFEPESLYSLCVSFLASQVHEAAVSGKGIPPLLAHHSTYLPEKVANAVIALLAKRNQVQRAALSFFSNPRTCRVTRAIISLPRDLLSRLDEKEHSYRKNRNKKGLLRRREHPTDASILGSFRHHPLIEIDISFRCDNLFWSLQSLVPHSEKSLQRLVMMDCPSFSNFESIRFFSNLRCLNLRGNIPLMDASLERLTSNLHCLAELNISLCSQLFSLTGLPCLKSTLRSLTIQEVPFRREGLSNILELTELRHLDISSVTDCMPLVSEVVIPEVLEKLTHLVSLDIGFALLGENSVVSLNQKAGSLEYLGLVGVQGLPSDLWSAGLGCTVAGDCSIMQICTALEHYCFGSVVGYMLDNLYEIIRDTELEDSARVHMLPILLKVLNFGCDVDVDSAVRASTIMFYLLKGDHYKCQDCAVLYEATRFLINCMEKMKDNGSLKSNCVLVVSQFMGQLEAVEPFRYRFIEACLECLQSSLQGTTATSLISFCVDAVNRLDFLTTDEQKAHFLQSGAIKIFVDFVTIKLALKELDSVMEDAWCFLWNVTDEYPKNCQELVERGGLQLFQSIYEENPESWDILMNMLGAMANVSEVPSLQKHFMKTAIIDMLRSSAENQQEENEISYTSTSILCHICANRDIEWVAATPKEHVFDTIRRVVLRWDVNSHWSFIAYRSLLPLLKIAKCFYCPAAQLWAAWALFKLCNDESKYCSMMEEEDGLPLLREICSDPTADTDVKKFAGEAQKLCLIRDDG